METTHANYTLPSFAVDLEDTLKTIVETNDSLVQEALAVAFGNKDYDALVYKLLRLSLAVNGRLESLYHANQQLVKYGQLITVNQTIADLFKQHIKKDVLDD